MDSGLIFGYVLVTVSSLVMVWAALTSVDAAKIIKKSEEERKFTDDALMKELERLRRLLMARRR